MTEPEPVVALRELAAELAGRGVRFAVVGGIAVSLRAEVRFTRDVDVALDLGGDAEAEALVRDLGARGYRLVALVEQDEVRRLATVRLRSPSGVAVDLLVASSGIEREIVLRATEVVVEGAGALPVARAEELLATKVLSMEPRRLQDRIDAQRLLDDPALDLEVVRADLGLIAARGFARKQDLAAKLEELIAERAGG